jgi:hypothetical protein
MARKTDGLRLIVKRTVFGSSITADCNSTALGTFVTLGSEVVLGVVE